MVGNREGWARGGHPFQFPKLTYKEAYELYLRLAGEVEARNAVWRLYLNELQRQRKSPVRTELELLDPVPRHQQIIQFWPKDR
jgi:hypothetical protein